MTSPVSIILDHITGFKRLDGGGLALRGDQAGQEVVVSVPAASVPHLVQHAIGGMDLPVVDPGTDAQTSAFNITGLMVGQADTGKRTITMFLNPEAAITFLLTDEQMAMIAESGALLGQGGAP